MRFKTQKIKMLTVPLTTLGRTPAKIIGEALARLDPDTKMLGAHDGIVSADLTWYFTNPNYPDVQEGQTYPEIKVTLDADAYGEVKVASVDEGLSTATLPTASGILGHLPIYPMGGPIVYNGPTPKPFSQTTKDLMDQLHKQVSKKLNQDAMDALVYGTKGIWITDDSMETKCECGVDASKSGGNHSDWCPKYGA